MMPGVTGEEFFQGALHESQGQGEKGQDHQRQIHDPGDAVMLVMPMPVAMQPLLRGCRPRQSS